VHVMSARKGFENTEQGRRKSFVFLTYLNIERSLRIQIETEKGREERFFVKICDWWYTGKYMNKAKKVAKKKHQKKKGKKVSLRYR